MLAIQFIKMYWTKENRTPEGSVMRRDYFMPEKIDHSVILESDGANYFLQRRLYIQADKVYTSTDYNKMFGNGYINATGPAESRQQERRRQFLLEQAKVEKDNLGLFYSDVKHINIPGIEIIKEEDAYRIRWYSLENGYQPVRRGYNEAFHHKNGRNIGKHIKCETAFVLRQGEAGKIAYNYRYTGYHGQHYEQYCIYFINEDKITNNSFITAKYEKEYVELADLF